MCGAVYKEKSDGYRKRDMGAERLSVQPLTRVRKEARDVREGEGKGEIERQGKREGEGGRQSDWEQFFIHIQQALKRVRNEERDLREGEEKERD